MDVQKWQAQEIVHLVENEQKSCSSFKNDGRRGAFEEDLERCMSRGTRSTKDLFIEMLGGQGADFLRGAAFCYSDRCNLRMTWHHFFMASATL